MSAYDPPLAPPQPVSVSPLTHLTTNLRLLRFTHADQLATLSLLTQPNHRATDAIFVFLFQHIDPARTRTTFRNLLALTGTDPAARRSFRAAVYTWLDELKPMFPGPVLVRKSFLDDGRGERFVDLLAALSFHALRCVLARSSAQAANRIAELAGPEGRQPGGPMDQQSLALVDEYRDELKRDVAVRQSCASLGIEYDARLRALDDEWVTVTRHLAASDSPDSPPPTSDIREQLIRAHQELGNQWARLSSAVPWEPARDLVRLALDPSHERPSLARPPNSSGSTSLDWTQLAAAAARTLTECAAATAATPVDANSVTKRAEHVRQVADQAQARCAKLQEQVAQARAKVHTLQQDQPPSKHLAPPSAFPIRLPPFPAVSVSPRAPPSLVATVMDPNGPSWAQPPIIPSSRTPQSNLTHYPAAMHTDALQVRKRSASAALLEPENLHPSPSTAPSKLRHRSAMGPRSLHPSHPRSKPRPSTLSPSMSATPFTPQHAHTSTITLAATPTATVARARPPAMWTLSPIHPSASTTPNQPPHCVVDLTAGGSRRVSFTFRPLVAPSAPPEHKPTPAARRTSSRRSTEMHWRIVDQMLSDAHAPVQPTGAPRDAQATWTPHAPDSDPVSPPFAKSPRALSWASSSTSRPERLSGAALAQQWFADPASPGMRPGINGRMGDASPRSHKGRVPPEDFDVSFDLDAFVHAEEGKGGLTSIGDEELPRLSREWEGGVGDGEGQPGGSDGHGGDDSLLMMLQS